MATTTKQPTETQRRKQAEQQRQALTDLRRENLQRIVNDRFNGNRAALAEAAVINPTQINFALTDGAHRRPIGENFARKIERNLSLPAGSLDRPVGAADGLEVLAYQPLPEMEELLVPSAAFCSMNLCKRWAKSMHIPDEAKLLVAELASDGMAPDIKAGDNVVLEWLADAQHRPVKPEEGFRRDGIYIIETKAGPLVRHVSRDIDASFVITSPNKNYTPQKEVKTVKFYARVLTPLRFGSRIG